jgi:hypothetical protein
MFADPFNVPYDQPGAAHTEPFTLVSPLSNGSVRVNLTADPTALPTALKISHQVVGKGSSARNRHLAKFETPLVVEDVPNPAIVASVYVVADIPSVGFTAEQKEGLWRSIVGLLRGTNGDTPTEGDATVFWDKFLSGQS